MSGFKVSAGVTVIWLRQVAAGQSAADNPAHSNIVLLEVLHHPDVASLWAKAVEKDPVTVG
jgi:hypothetical protein